MDQVSTASFEAFWFEVIPILNWETEVQQARVSIHNISSVAIFPTVFIPSTDSMWVAGMSFGYALGILLIMCGVTIGASLPYFIDSLFYNKIQVKERRMISFELYVTLLRISPFPYTVYNYCAVATGVKYVPYLFGTLLGKVPEVFVAIYT
ncbi:putative SNARE associated golgi family protein [Helianthus anomalus]